MPRISLKTWFSGLIASLFVVIPMNLFWQIPFGSAYVHGLRVDYLIPKLYLSWIVAVVLLLSWWWSNREKVLISKILHSKYYWLVLAFIGLFAGQFWTARPISAIYLLLVWMTAWLAVHAIKQLAPHVNQTVIAGGALLSVGLQTFLGWWQFLTQHSFAPYFVFGEPNITNWNGITKAIWFDQELSLPYGSTTHPNVLAFWLAIGWFLSGKIVLQSSSNNQRNMKLAWWLVTPFIFVLILITQSMSGILTLAIAAILLFLFVRKIKVKPKIFAIIMVIGVLAAIIMPIFLLTLSNYLPKHTDTFSWQRRNELFLATTELIRQNFWFGTGVNQSTIQLQNYRTSTEIVRFVQPVHNAFWLLLSEIGVLGLVALVSGAMVTNKSSKTTRQELWWLLLLPAAALDHFLISQPPGIFATALLIGLSQANCFQKYHD